MDKEDILSARNIADEQYSSGLYCAESVVIAIAKTYKIENDLFPKVATALCGGMSRTCGMCGALTGAMLGVSAIHGRSNPGESVEKVFKATQKLVSEFESEFGNKNCQELLECDLGTLEGQEKFNKENLNSRCHGYTVKAAQLAAEIIEEYNMESLS